MAKLSSQAGTVIKNLLEKFPNASTRTLAKIAFRDDRALFNNYEHARSIVRIYRGANGEHNRATMKTKFPKTKWTEDPFKDFNDGRREVEGWGPVHIDGPARVLILPDIHLPYHDNAGLLPALKAGKAFNPSIVLLNGDFLDCHSVSSWTTDPRQKDWAGELKIGRDFLKRLRQLFPKARIICKEGNHEERWERRLFTDAPALIGVDDFELEKLLRMDSVGAEYVKGKRVIMLGKLPCIHGHEYRFAISNPVGPARGFFLRATEHCIGSHLHQSTSYSKMTITGRLISTWSTGCLCYLHPQFNPLNDWSHGFATVEIDRDGAFHVENHKILKGKIY